MVTRRHTHREDHLQVVEHLDLLREALAAPSHQVVLTTGREVGTGYYQGLNMHWVKISTSLYSVPTPCWPRGTPVFETGVVSPSKTSQSCQGERG